MYLPGCKVKQLREQSLSFVLPDITNSNSNSKLGSPRIGTYAIHVLVKWPHQFSMDTEMAKKGSTSIRNSTRKQAGGTTGTAAQQQPGSQMSLGSQRSTTFVSSDSLNRLWFPSESSKLLIVFFGDRCTERYTLITKQVSCFNTKALLLSSFLTFYFTI